MSPIDRRDGGAFGAALLSEALYNEIICDFVHVSQEVLEMMFRIKKEDGEVYHDFRFRICPDSREEITMKRGGIIL